jgi:hypothetical protein
MEGLAHLVAESLVRHGFEPSFDHRRLQWSNWFRCQDSFSLVLAPCKPGIFALGEEVATFCAASEPRSRHPERSEGSPSEGKRMLALFQISEADDVGMALGRLFLSGNPARERFASGRCFARYVVIEDANQRRTALTALERWMASSSEAATGVQQAISDDNRIAQNNDGLRDAHIGPDAPVRGAERSSVGFVSGPDFSRATSSMTSTAALAADASPQPESSNKQAQIGPPSPIPSGF